MASSYDQPIIIKKVKKHAHAHHGGAWKIAYADFVTAMMAFFLLLWLISMTTPEQKKGLADYFAPASISETIAQARAHFEQGLQQQRSFADSLGTVTRPEFVERRTLPMLWNIQDALLDVQLAKTSGRFASSVVVDARAGADLTSAFGMLSGVNGTTGRLDQVVRPEQVQQFDLVHFQ